ncbi:hypothetical protein O0L34_g4330 [Tuta absoluta]|nr:hypothetical protein O0L34_g4330 [Tuta absoluta]
MVISFWHSCVVLSCLVIPCLLAKPFNLNEAIAAEERQKALHTTTRPKFGTRLLTKPFNLNEVIAAEERQKAVHKTRPKFGIGLFAKPLNLNEDISAEESQTVIQSTTRPKTETSERFSLNKLLRTSPLKLRKSNLTEKLAERFSLSNLFNKTSPGRFNKVKETENKIPRGKKISSLQYRKTFQIKSPLKPKKLKTFEKARYRRRNQSIKREISEDEEITKKYLPLLKSISLLFDNILSETDDSFEIRIGDIDRIRTYPQYFQEIPLALGETIMDTVREAAPHFTQALKEISPGIMEIVNVFPEAENITPIQKIMKKIPTVLHESMQAALSSEEDYAETAPIYNVQSIEEDWTMTSRRDKPTNTILGKIEETSTNFKDTLMQKGKTAFDTLEETSMNLQEKINSKLEETKQKAQHLFNNLFEATEDFYPKRASTHYSPKKTSKKASSASNTISPEIRDSLSEMASLPQKIKKLVQQMQR